MLMFHTTPQRFFLQAATLCVWLLLAASATYWVLQINAGSGQQSSLAAAADRAEPINTTSLGRLLGTRAAAAAPPTAAVTRFALKGVVSGATGRQAALIAIDDKPARPYIIGSVIEDGLILQSTAAREVRLAASKGGPVVMTLQMPPLEK